MNKKQVLLVDDHMLVLENLKALLELEEDFAVVGVAKDGAEAIEQAKKLSPDIIVMDFSLPKMDGIEATENIKKFQPGVKVIILSVYDEVDNAQRARKAGIIKWVSKNSPPRELVEAIRSTAKVAS